jgi:transcription factor SPN1
MLNAADQDTKFRKDGQPSVAKLMLLPAAMEKLGRMDTMDIYLDNGILTAIMAWLEPSEVDGSLPPLDVQRNMVTILEKYDVDKDFVDRWVGKTRI